MKINIGQYNVIHTHSLLIPQEQEAWIEFSESKIDVKLKLSFKNDKNDKTLSRFEISGNEDHGTIEFINWSASAISFDEPIKLVWNGDEEIYIMAFGHTVGSVIKLDIQFYTKDAS